MATPAFRIHRGLLVGAPRRDASGCFYSFPTGRRLLSRRGVRQTELTSDGMVGLSA